MLYFKNSDLAYTHHVSVRTVRNWIEAAKQGKLDLDLHTHNGRQYVSNTARNLSTIERMVEDRKKYRPHRAVKVVTPKPEFYRLFNQAQVYDIVRNLEIYKEIPHQYSYFNGGAKHFADYANRMAEEDNPNTLNSTIKLLEKNQSYIDNLLDKYKRVNIVDIGVGNAIPVRQAIAHLVSVDKMGRYIGLDISSEMLDIARNNLEEWFGDSFEIENYELDINRERFSNILAEEYISENAQSTVNIIFFLGGTLSNFRSPASIFRSIQDSMGLNDILIHSQKLDSASSRRYFDFNSGNETEELTLAPIHKFIVQLLNIDDSFYDIEMGYDDEQSERYIKIKLNIALSIEFIFEQGARTVSFNKGDSILLWRARQSSAMDIVNEMYSTGFYPLQTSQTDDQEYLLTISRIKRS